MQTRLPQAFLDTIEGQQADRILRSCVHCGFCTATCPTYQILGDELDSPRGRIYLIKQMFENQQASQHTRLHLDRCLTCRSCETTCPSGVEYGKLIDLGREWVETNTSRPLLQRFQRLLLRKIIPYPARFRLLLRLGGLFKPLLPTKLKNKVPVIQPSLPWPHKGHRRRMVALNGCAQSVSNANIDASAARVLDHFNIDLISDPASACCGSLNLHLAASDDAKQQMRNNIEAWHAQLDNGAEAIISSASGCTVTMKDYGHYFENEPEYSTKASAVANKVSDISEVIEALVADMPELPEQANKLAFHAPCTLQHGLQINGKVEKILQKCGYTLTEVKDSHLCCGSAGTYSILQPELSQQLLANKTDNLSAGQPDIIVTANIGCLLHIATNTTTPVMHWIELVENALQQH